MAELKQKINGTWNTIATTFPQRINGQAITKELLASLDADFVAGNIKKDVDLFGLIGTLESGGGGIVKGTITFAEPAQYAEITHNLGKIPTAFMMFPFLDWDGSFGSATCYGAFAQAGKNQLLLIGRTSARVEKIIKSAAASLDTHSEDTVIREATATTIKVYSDTFPLAAGKEFVFLAW